MDDVLTTRDATVTTVAGYLEGVPPAAARYLRDHIAGLEAEAGNARGRLVEERERHRIEVDRLTLAAVHAEEVRDLAVAERDSAIAAAAGEGAAREDAVKELEVLRQVHREQELLVAELQAARRRRR